MSATAPRTRRVLVIDDEVKFCAVVKEFLTGRGHEVTTVSNGREALSQFEHFAPDVILLDLVMPGFSGLDLLKLIRERPFPPKVILVTAVDDPEVAEQAMRLGAHTYVAKPVALETLERLITGVWINQPSSAPPTDAGQAS